jgi:hypothetical protein
VVKGLVEVPNNTNACIGALDNFFRAITNFTIIPPTGKTNYFRTSQACPVRDIIVQGDFAMAEREGGCGGDPSLGGYSSGGFVSNTQVNGKFDLATQQQFYVEKTSFGSTSGGAWNIEFNGCKTSLKTSSCPSTPMFTVNATVQGVSRSPPRLFYDVTTDSYQINLPIEHVDANGIQSHEIDTSITNIHIADQFDSADDISSYISSGKSIIFPPGVFLYKSAIVVNRENAVIVGSGFSTVRAINGNRCIVVDAGNVFITGLILESGGTKTSPCLLHVEANGDSDKPVWLSDIFCRVGGREKISSCKTMVIVDRDNTQLNHMWLWRADHFSDGEREGGGFAVSMVDHALIINGKNVTARAIFAEHTLKELVVWNGENGLLQFLQSELAYEAAQGWDHPALLVLGTNFKGESIGVYSFFASKWSLNNAPSVTCAIRVRDDVKNTCLIESACTVFLNKDTGDGEIKHVINNTGSTSDASMADKPIWCGFGGSTVCPTCT